MTTTFQGLWHGPPLGALREACLESFTRLGYGFELYTYGEIRVPSGIRLRDASQIVPSSEIFYYKNPRTGDLDLGPFSDLFRFKLLYERGGWWSDVDTICLSREIPQPQRAWASENPECNPSAVGTSQIAMMRADPLAKELHARCLELSRTDFPHRESLGPHLLTATIRDMQLPTNVFGTADTFYPIRWIEMFKLWLPEFADEIRQRARAAFFMPIYQSFPRSIGLSLGKNPPVGSFLCDALGLNGASARYTVDEILAGTRAFFRANDEWAVAELRAVSGDAIVRRLGLG